MAKRKYKELEQQLGYKFKDEELLEMALTHPSFRFETDGVVFDNQRLEFLGDAVLDLLLADYLYAAFPDEAEGFLTAARSRLASGKALGAHGRRLGLGDYLRMGRGEETSGGRKRQAALADAIEALIGAAYIDKGYRGAARLFRHVIAPEREQLDGGAVAANPKGKLQEYVQSQWKRGPEYRIIDERGPAHARVFTVVVTLPDGSRCRGTACSKQQAEIMAAQAMLQRIRADDEPRP